MSETTFWQDTLTYARQIRRFDRSDWKAYVAWVGLMAGLFVSTAGFTLIGWAHGVRFPSYVWNVPAGTAIFICAIAFDTIGHRTTYKEELKKGEALVHHITILAGVTSCLALCLAYRQAELWRYPAITLIALSILYSLIDEALHWRRYLNGHSDRVEMWSHFFIFVGHLLMILSWYHWFDQGYPGVAETLKHLPV